MAQIHERVRSLNNPDSDQVKEALAQYFQKLPRNAESDHSEWLLTLELILTRFPKFCMQHRSTTETYLVQFLDSENECWVVGAAKCCHALQQVRPSNDKSATAKSSWRQQMALLCSAAHGLMGAAFTDTVDIYKATGYFHKTAAEDSAAASTVLGAALAQLPSGAPLGGKARAQYATLGPAQKSAVLCRRLQNVFTFMQAMLVEVYPVAKPVRPQSVLDAVVRALSVTSGGRPQGAPGGAGGRAPGGPASGAAPVKAQALRTLDALIVCLGSNLIPYSPLVFRLVGQTLRWTADHTDPDSQRVRRGCYETLALWSGALRCHKLDAEAPRGPAAGLEEDLLGRILEDVTPHAHLIQLTMSNQSTKNLSKKAKRKMANTLLGQSGIASHIPGEKNKEVVLEENPEVVLAALRCLEVLLTTSGIFMKPTTHKKVQECLVRQCYSVSAESDGARGLALCRALEASRLAAPAALALPTHHCLAIYSRLQGSPHAELSQFSARALLSVRCALHAAPPTLSFAPAPRAPAAAEPRRAAVSERNRAALAALLGRDKLPQPSEDIITISDEINHKQTVDEDDKISVSSQSTNAVEIDESNGVDLDSPEANFEDPIEADETDFTAEPSVTNGAMKLLDFDNKEKDISRLHKIHELPTQLPHNTSIDSVAIADDDSDSVEVSYDHSRNPEQITFLEKLEGDNLPSTGDTDDVQITCGQAFRSSQDSGAEKITSGVDTTESIVKTIDQMEVVTSQTIMEDVVTSVDMQQDKTENVDVNMGLEDTAKECSVNVEDMLADFVDEKA